MNKAWLGYLSSALFLLAGVLMIAGNKMIVGILFVVLAVASVVVNIFMYRNKN